MALPTTSTTFRLYNMCTINYPPNYGKYEIHNNLTNRCIHRSKHRCSVTGSMDTFGYHKPEILELNIKDTQNVDKKRLERIAQQAIKEQQILEQNAHIPELNLSPEGIQEHKEEEEKRAKRNKLASKVQEIIEISRTMLTMREVTPQEALTMAEEFVTIASEYATNALEEVPEDVEVN